MRRWMEALTERLNLPEDLLDGVSRLTLTGGRTLRIENYRCMLSFSEALLEVSCRKQTLRVRGEDLRIVSMDRQELLLDGTVLAVEVDPA